MEIVSAINFILVLCESLIFELVSMNQVRTKSLAVMVSKGKQSAVSIRVDD